MSWMFRAVGWKGNGVGSLPSGVRGDVWRCCGRESNKLGSNYPARQRGFGRVIGAAGQGMLDKTTTTALTRWLTCKDGRSCWHVSESGLTRRTRDDEKRPSPQPQPQDRTSSRQKRHTSFPNIGRRNMPRAARPIASMPLALLHTRPRDQPARPPRLKHLLLRTPQAMDFASPHGSIGLARVLADFACPNI